MSDLSKHQVGKIAELIAQQYFIKAGYIVSKTTTPFNEYDLVVDDGDKLEKVQVKTAYWDNNKKRYLCSLVTSHIRGNGNRYNKKYTENSFDLLCAVEIKNKAIYIIPMSEILGRRSITLYPLYDKKQNIGFELYKVDW